MTSLTFLRTFNILVVNTKIAYTEVEIMKGKKMFCCFERDSLLEGRRRQELLTLCVLPTRPVGKAHSSALGRSNSSNSLLSDTDLVLFQVAEDKVEAAPNCNILSCVL